MDCLRDHLVGSDEKNKKLRITVDRFCSRLRLVKFPHGRSAHTLNFSENCLDLHVDQMASPPVGDSKLERGLVTIRRDDGIAAVK